MTHTKQPLCIKKTDTNKKSDPKDVLLDSLARLYAELEDFQNKAEEYIKNNKQTKFEE